MTDFDAWSYEVDKVICDGGTGGCVSISDIADAIRHDDSLTKFEKEALIHKLWEAF